MKFCVEIGETHKSSLALTFNQLLGKLEIALDNQIIAQKRQWFSEPVMDVHEFEILRPEKLQVRIEKERLRFCGSKYRVYVNSRLTHFFKGA
jgi:hypothetical protein